MPSLRSALVRRSMVAAFRARRRDDITPDTAIEDVDVVAMRAELDRLASLARLPRDVTRRVVTTPCMDAEWVVHGDADQDRVMLWVHGGAHCLCSTTTHRPLAAALSRLCRARVLLPDYPLAPESPFPEGRDRLVELYRWLLDDEGVDPARLVVGGDSSGGGLALSTLIELRDQGAPLPAAAVLLSPWVDLALQAEAWSPDAGVEDPMLPIELAPLAIKAYLADLDPQDPGPSPLYADLKGLPPMLVHVGTDEVLSWEGQELVARARAAGVEADLGSWQGMWHVFQAFPGFPESRHALREIGGFVRRHVPLRSGDGTVAPHIRKAS